MVAPKLPPNVFIGSVRVDGERVVKETGRVVMEVLEHLSVLPGAEVQVTLEFRVSVADGVKDDVVQNGLREREDAEVPDVIVRAE